MVNTHNKVHRPVHTHIKTLRIQRVADYGSAAIPSEGRHPVRILQKKSVGEKINAKVVDGIPPSRRRRDDRFNLQNADGMVDPGRDGRRQHIYR